jgi:hypothetical protein
LPDEHVAEMAEALRFWPETLTTGLVLRLCEPLNESVGETRTDFMCWSQHLPRPTPQVEVHDERRWMLIWLGFA